MLHCKKEDISGNYLKGSYLIQHLDSSFEFLAGGVCYRRDRPEERGKLLLFWGLPLPLLANVLKKTHTYTCNSTILGDLFSINNHVYTCWFE